MAEDSPELKTLKKCSYKLLTALKGDHSQLVYFLAAEGFFSDGEAEKVLNPVSLLDEEKKAGELVKWIKNRVEQDSGGYHTLMRWFEAAGNHYSPIVKILNEEFARQGGTVPAQTTNTGPSSSLGRGGASIIDPTPSQPTYIEYELCIPAENRSMLLEKLDFDKRDIDLHLGEIADTLDGWEDVAPLLGLKDINISDIKDTYPQKPSQQRRAALRKWKGMFGFKATYGKLLEVCVTKEKLKTAEKIVMLLGASGGPSLNSPSRQQPLDLTRTTESPVVPTTATSTATAATTTQPAATQGRNKLNYFQLAKWLSNEGVAPSDVDILKAAGINERKFMRLKVGSAELKEISQATQQDLIDLQKDLEKLESEP